MKRTLPTRLALAICLVLVLPLFAAAPAASVTPPVDDIYAHPGMEALAAEMRAMAASPEELAELEEVLRWLEAHPEELLDAQRLLDETPPVREYSEGAGKDEAFGILRTDDRSKPVLITHGRDNYNMDGYTNMRNYLLNVGFSKVYRVGYYGGECNIEYAADHHGSHGNWYGGSGEHSAHTGCNGVGGAQVHDLDTDIRHIGYHFAVMVHDHFGANGVTVDAMGHSMGGLLMRYAIAKSGSGGVWPPKLRIEDSVTMGTPHGGLGTSWCKLSPWSDVRQMCSDSSFMTWLKNYAQDPQGDGGTDWTLMGSDCDGWVSWDRAVDMKAAHKLVYVDPCYGHSDYYTDVSTTNDATVDYMDAPSTSWTRWSSAPHSVKWTNYAATYGSW